VTHFTVKRIGGCFYEMTAHETPEAPASERFCARVVKSHPGAGTPVVWRDLVALESFGPTPDEAFEALAANINQRRLDNGPERDD
jgi:hypothetical protein